MRWAEPGWLLLLTLVPLPWLLARARPRMAWPSLDGFTRRGSFLASAGAMLPSVLRGLAVGCMALALARPQTVGGRTRVAGQGVAIVAALDQSSTMNQVDFPSPAGPVSRLEAAKATLQSFVEGRPDDLIGLIVFANLPDRASPPTLDHAFLLETARSVRPARPGDDGTNLGDAIALGLEDLRAAPPRKKVLILLTDGRNSPAVPHPLDPVAGARLARELGVTLHTIAIGRAGGIVREVEPITGLNLTAQGEAPDFALLERLAQIGGGRSFAAADAADLARVFQTIDALEKSPVQGEIKTRYRERYPPLVALALGLLTFDRVLSAGRLRRLP